MNRPSVGIILLNYNRFKDTIECIHSLHSITYPSYKILLVDNCSTDDSYDNLCRAFHDIEIITTTRNVGYTGGINYGIRHLLKSHYEYILILNNDTLVEPDFLDKLVDAMERDNAAAASCGTILCEHDRRSIWYASGKMIPWRGLAVHVDKNRKYVYRQSTQPVTFITGCMVLLRVSNIEKIGFLDERYFMYLDDIEYSQRIIQNGYSLLYVSDSIIYHKVLGEKESAFKAYYSIRNRLLLINTVCSGYNRIIARLYFIGVLSVKLILWRLTRKSFYEAARTGVIDYRKNNFYMGNGQKFYSTP